MENPIIKKLLANGKLETGNKTIETSYDLSELIYKALSASNMKAEFYFDKKTGKIVFEKVLGKDENGNFYNAYNNNLEKRKEEIKKVIVGVLLDEYKKPL